MSKNTNRLKALSTLEDQKRYWLTKLDGELPHTGFPTDTLIEGQERKKQLTFTFPEDMARKLTKIGSSDQALYMLFLSGLNYLLYKYTGNQEIIIGTPIFVKDYDQQVLNNVLAIRSHLSLKMTFKELLLSIRETVIEADKNQDYPLYRVLNQLKIPYQVNKFPLSNVLLIYQNLQNKGYIVGEDTDICFDFMKTDKKICFKIEYKSGLYRSDTIKRIAEHLINFFKNVVEDLNIQLTDVQILSPKEQKFILTSLAGSEARYPEKCLHEIFEEQVDKNPEACALIFEKHQLSYDELNQRANQLAQFLRFSGVQTGDLIGIMVERSIEMVVGILAILKSGGAYVPIDPHYPEDRVSYILQDSQIKILLSQDGLVSKVEFIGQIIDITDTSIYAGKVTNLDIVNTPDDLAYIIYTSGSTGKPKGVMVEHRNVVRLMINDQIQFDFTDQDIWTAFHSFCFDFSVWEMYGALLYGGKLVIISRKSARDPKAFLRILHDEQVTVLNQTPTAFYNLISEVQGRSDTYLSSIRYVIFGGEALKPLLLKTWREKYPESKLINMYGITETTVHVTFKEITDEEIVLNQSNIGKPIPTLNAYILDKNLQMLPIGVAGELCVGGAGVARGYLNRPELTSKKFVTSPHRQYEKLYRSGDLARLLANGDMEYLGRIDRQVKIRGFRIELGEIENQLLNHKWIQDAVVLTKRDHQENNYLCAFLVSDKDLNIETLRNYLSKTLPDYMIPAYFVPIQAMPLTANGKIDLKALPDPLESRIETEYVAPANGLEDKLAKIWSRVLQLEKIGTKDSFTDIGGDSIRAVRLVSVINKECQTDLKIEDLYTYQTIKKLASYIQSSNGEFGKTLDAGLAIIATKQEQILQDNLQRSKLPEDYEDFFPLSSIQQGMVFYSKIKPEVPMYHNQFVYPVKFREFDFAILKKTLKLLMAKHPILRTTFFLTGFDEPFQVVHKEIEPQLSFVDISDLSIEEQEVDLNRFISLDLKNRFELDQGILWRIGVFKTGVEDCYILFSAHHAIEDGWSIASLSTEFVNLYRVLLTENLKELPALKSSYKEYVAIELSRKDSKQIIEYWSNLLQGYTRNKLPFNISNKKINNLHVSKKITEYLSDELFDNLKNLAKNRGWTLKGICLSAYLYLLSIVTTENDIVTGVVTHDRPVVEDSDKVLGCFLNTVPIRMEITSKMTGTNLIDQVDIYLREVKSYEIFLADIAALIGDVSNLRNPIFDNLFNFVDFHIYNELDTETMSFEETELELITNEMTNTLFDLEVSTTLNRLALQIKYSPNYFYDENIRTAFDLYVRILKQLTTNPNVLLNAMELLSVKEKQRIIYDLNNTAAEYPKGKLMHQLVEEQVERTPDNIALTFKGQQMTYRELNRRANQLAHLLIESGVQNGDHVAILMERGLAMVVSLLGILKTGAAYIPIDPEYPQARQQYILKNSMVTGLVVDHDYGLEEANTICLDVNELNEYSVTNPDIKKNSTDLAYVIYTSGSTGVPKGVMIEHHSAVNLITWVNREFTVGAKDSLLFITSMCFDLSVYDMFGILASGARCVISGKEQVQDPEQLKNLLIEEKITFWDSVPTTMNHLVNMLELSDSYQQLDLRLVFMSGDWIPVKLPERLKRYFPNARVISLGGATEGTIWSIYYPIKEVSQFQTSIPYGKPLANNYFYILDANQNPVPEGVAGELYIGGVGVARGYINNPEKTASAYYLDKFIESPTARMYRTGDMGRTLPDGNIEFLGRKDHQVKIRGFRVELGEIESLLLRHVKIKETVVTDRLDENGDKYLCAYLVQNSESDEKRLGLSELKEFLTLELPNYMIPSYFVYLKELPLNSNGKVDRKALPEPTGFVQTDADYLPPKTETEERLSKIWVDILGVERFGIKDDFFDLGGHSLKATQLTLRVQKEFQQDLPLIEVFTTPTIEKLAAYLDNKARRLDYAEIPKIGLKEYYPVSSAQERLYILNRLEKDSMVYNIPEAFVIEGELDKERFSIALQKLIERHEALRTSFELVDGIPQQKIHPTVDFKIAYHQLSEDKDLDIIEFIKPFDLGKAPLIRIHLFEVMDKQILLFDLHHIIADGVSMSILINDFIDLYQGQTLSELRIQYKDFANWQRQIFSTDQFKEQKKYWLDSFAGEISVLDLPTDYLRPKEVDFCGDIVRVSLDLKITSKLKKLMEKENTTLYMTLLAAYYVLLHKYTNQEDIIVGSPIAGRPHTDLDGVIGMFANTLALRSYPEKNKRFHHFLAEVKETTLIAYQNQDYQFEMLVDALNLHRDLGRNPLFDTMFVLQNQEMAAKKMEDVTFTPYQFENKTAKFDLLLNAVDIDDQIEISLEYRTSLFKKETVAGFAKHLVKIVQQVIDNPNLTLREIEMITDEEKEKILNQFNYPNISSPDRTIQEIFEEQVDKNPGQKAVIFGEKQLTYSELNQKANQLARRLREMGVGRDKIVALMISRSIEMIVSLLGILKAGGAYLPIDPELPAERIDYMLRDADVTLLLTKEDLLIEKSLLISEEKIMILDQASYHSDGTNLEHRNQPFDLLYVIYTSGSTGQPKGVMLEHTNLVNLIDYQYSESGIYFNSRVLQFTTISFDVSHQEIFSTLLAGGELYLIDNETRKSPDKLLAFVQREKIEIIFLPTSFFKFITAETEYMKQIPSNLKDIIIAGEQLIITDEIKRIITEKGVRLHNHYGPSETHVVSTYTIDSPEKIRELPPIGKPIANTRLYIGSVSDKTGEINLAPVGVVGELLVAGEAVGRGYLNRSELTAKKFLNDPYHLEQRLYRTGDQARWLSDGNIEFMGRVDHQVKIRGYRVEIGEVESKLLNYELVKEAVVQPVGEVGSKYLVAYVTSGQELTTSELRDYLTEELPEYMIPSYFIQLGIIPMTPTGKIDRKALPQPEGQANTGTEYLAPKNDLEEKLVSIWEEILGVKEIGVIHNFFELGGHSLKATILSGKIHKELNKDIPLREIFKNPTIRSLAQYLASEEEKLYSEIRSVEKQDYYPASSAQKRLFLQNQFEGSGISYNMPGAITIEGRVDKNWLEQVFIKLVERHETLRTSFEMREGEVIQKVHANVSLEIETIQASEDEVMDLVPKLIQPFHLDQPPLVRVQLIQLSKELHVLFFDLHHIISDGISMEILIKEFSALYQGEILPDLTIQYKDFSVWQNQLFEAGEIRLQKDFWLNLFSDEIPVLNLPTDYARPPIQSFEGSTINFSIDGELKKALEELANQKGSTMYMVLLAVFNLLLYKYTGQGDIVIGSPIAGRRHVELHHLIGVFVNMLALRNKPKGSTSFTDFLAEVKEMTLRAYENQDYQFEELVEHLNLKRDLSRSPLFNVVFSLQNQQSGKQMTGTGDLKFTQYEFPITVAKYDLTLDAVECENKIRFSFEYCTDLFEKETIRRMARHYINLLKGIVKNSEKKLSDLKILSSIEEDQILNDFNNTRLEYPKEKTISQVFEERVKLNRHRLAIVSGDIELTYEELNLVTNQLANFLRQNGVTRGMLAGIMIERSLEMIVGMLAILKAGGAYLPIDPNYPEERINYILEDSNLTLLLTDTPISDTLDSACRIIDIKSTNNYLGSNSNLLNINEARDLAYVIYTSGSTGRPKGVMVEHRGVLNLTEFYDRLFNLGENQKIIHMANVAFDASVGEIFPSLLKGSTIHILTKEQALDSEQFRQYVVEKEITIAHFVPLTLQEHLAGKEKLPSLDQVLVGGDILQDTLRDQIIHLGYKLTNHYGPTEGTVDATVARTEKGKDNIGKPISNTRVYILDRDNNLAPIGVSGEMCIAGDGIARGYLNKPSLTQSKFVQDPFISGEIMYRTGDCAIWQLDGSIKYVGRIDNQVKIRGYRIEPGEIVTQILQNKKVSDAIVIDKKDSRGVKYLVAYLVISSAKFDLNELQIDLSSTLPDYMIPSCFITLEELPITPNGKLNVAALPDPDDYLDMGVKYTGPTNKIEQVLIDIWQDVLEIKGLGINHNFFEVGGHSLKAVALIAKIRKELNVEVPLSIVFKNPSIKRLAEYIGNLNKDEYIPIQPIELQDYYPVSSAQKRIYLHQQIIADTSYNMPFALILEGNLDMARLKNALKQLTIRHETLRTFFEVVDDQIVQKISQEVDIDIAYLEMNTNDLAQLIKKFIRPFILDKSPLLRVAIFKLDQEKYLLLFDMHHIISDGISTTILTREFSQLYRGESLPRLKIQYKDYAAWHNSLLQSEKIDEIRSYWREQLAEYEYTELPVRKISPQREGAKREIELNTTITEKINLYCQKHNVTRSTFILAVFNIILSKKINQKQITIGIPTAGRGREELENIIGVFLNVLVLSSKVPGMAIFADYLTSLQNHLMEAQENQDYPYEYLYEDAKKICKIDKESLFSIVYNYLPYSKDEELNLEGISITPYQLEEVYPKYRLTLYVRERTETISLRAVFTADLNEEMIENILDSFEKVISIILNDDNIVIEAISLVGSDNINQFAEDFAVEFDDFDF